jgi:iron(III) transport system substrate-binding protein
MAQWYDRSRLVLRERNEENVFNETNEKERAKASTAARSAHIIPPLSVANVTSGAGARIENQEGEIAVTIAVKARAFVLALALAAALLAAGAASSRTDAGAAKPKPNPDSIANLIKRSKSESGLVFYGNPPTANFRVLVERFNKVYPWVKVTSYDLEDNTIFSKYASEAQQGVRTADVLIASAPNLWVFASRKQYALNFAPIGLKAYPKFVKQFRGVYVMSPDPAIIVYNKVVLDKTPTSVTAIANDAGTYKKVTGYTVENTFGYTGLWGYVHRMGWSSLQKIGKRLSPTTGVASQLQLVAQGGASAAFLTSPTARFRIATDSNLQRLLDWSYAKDATPLIPRGIAITKKAASPASAKLFLDFVYSKAGQQAMCDAGFTAFRNGFTPSGGCRNTLADVYKNVPRKNVVVVPFSQKFVNDRPKFAVRWHSIFG